MNISSLIIKSALAFDPVVGQITIPGGVPSEVGKTGDFVSAIVRFFMVVAGVFTLWQFLSGGFQFISSAGDKGKIAEATQKLTMSITGLVVMTASFIIIAILSMILFGNPTEILSPSITPI